jgi:hypothetical protein
MIEQIKCSKPFKIEKLDLFHRNFTSSFYNLRVILAPIKYDLRELMGAGGTEPVSCDGLQLRVLAIIRQKNGWIIMIEVCIFDFNYIIVININLFGENYVFTDCS